MLKFIRPAPYNWNPKSVFLKQFFNDWMSHQFESIGFAKPITSVQKLILYSNRRLSYDAYDAITVFIVEANLLTKPYCYHLEVIIRIELFS